MLLQFRQTLHPCRADVTIRLAKAGCAFDLNREGADPKNYTGVRMAAKVGGILMGRPEKTPVIPSDPTSV